MPADLSAKLAQRLGIGRERVLPVCALLDSGLHPVFILHYRKSAAGNMDEASLRRLIEVRRELAALEDARQRAVRIAEAAGAATPQLCSRLDEAADAESIEDLVRPLRPKRRTAGFVAKERGLEPLADYAWSLPPDGPDLRTRAAEFVNPAKEVRSLDEALAGAGHILAERIADNAKVRGAARRLVLEKGILKAQQAHGAGKQAAEFRPYFKFQEPISHLPPHRILAITRGERIKALKVAIEVPAEALKDRVFAAIFSAEFRRTAPPPDTFSDTSTPLRSGSPEPPRQLPPADPSMAQPDAAGQETRRADGDAAPPADPSMAQPDAAGPETRRTDGDAAPPADPSTAQPDAAGQETRRAEGDAAPPADPSMAQPDAAGQETRRADGDAAPPACPSMAQPDAAGQETRRADADAAPAEGQPAAPAAPAPLRPREFLEAVATDALRRLVLPAVEREVRRQLLDRADAHAVEVFAANLRSLLMTRPIGGKRVLAIQPGLRTGCKVATLDAAGTLLGETIIYPLEPQKKTAEGRAALMAEIQRHAVEIITIGNGTGCREVEQLVSELIQEQSLAIEYAVVSEAGASAYADSDLAKQEFPNLDAAIRATVSIGRRLQDPLAEFVRIEPRAIGVGLYQHDVNQDRLRRALDETMESCVAVVGADANAASPSMLQRIPGMSESRTAVMVARRQAAPLTSREEIRSLPGWDDRTFQAAAGFLRIHGENPLDATRVHPESYAAAEQLLARIGHSLADLRTPESARAVRQHLTGLPLEPLAAELQVPLPDLMELVGALQSPQSDPRSQHHGPILRSKMRELADLQPGMWVKGTVRNVVDFGAFVDIGLKEDGLVHISEFSRRYVRNPLKFLHVGDVVDVRIVSIDADKRRIALTLISETPPPKREAKPRVRRPPEETRRPSAPEGAPAEAGAPAAAAAPSDQGVPSRASGPRGRTEGRPPRRPPSPDRARPPRGAPGETRPAETAGAESGGPARPGAGERRPRPPMGERRPERRPPSGDHRPPPTSREGAGADRGERPRGPRVGRGPRDRGPRSGTPRIIVSKSRGADDDRPPDALGLPKIRWASYDSDPHEEEFEEMAEQVAPDAQPVDSEARSAESTGVAEGPQATAQPEAPAAEPPPAEAPAAEPPAAKPPEAAGQV